MCTLRYLIDKSNRTQRLEGILLKKSLRYRLEYKLSTTDSCKNFCSPHYELTWECGSNFLSMYGILMNKEAQVLFLLIIGK